MNRQADKVAQRLNAVLSQQVAEMDGHLLERLVRHRDVVTLEVLVHRHGGMVWRVCHHILQNHQDAENAFQATFFVLVPKAASVSPREMVGNLLYGVARQTALKARATAAKRRTRDRLVVTMPEPAAPETISRHDVRHVLDQVLGRLPDKYRVAIVLCELEGHTRTEAARHIGCPKGKTVDLVICFECFQVKVYDGAHEAKGFLITAGPQPAFDRVLTAAGVKLAGKPEK